MKRALQKPVRPETYRIPQINNDATRLQRLHEFEFSLSGFVDAPDLQASDRLRVEEGDAAVVCVGSETDGGAFFGVVFDGAEWVLWVGNGELHDPSDVELRHHAHLEPPNMIPARLVIPMPVLKILASALAVRNSKVIREHPQKLPRNRMAPNRKVFHEIPERREHRQVSRCIRGVRVGLVEEGEPLRRPGGFGELGDVEPFVVIFLERKRVNDAFAQGFVALKILKCGGSRSNWVKTSTAAHHVLRNRLLLLNCGLSKESLHPPEVLINFGLGNRRILQQHETQFRGRFIRSLGEFLKVLLLSRCQKPIVCPNYGAELCRRRCLGGGS